MKAGVRLSYRAVPAGSFILALVLMFLPFPAPAQSATISDCGFEDAEAQDGTWFGGDDTAQYTETEVFPANPGNVWTTSTGGVRMDTGIFHGGAQSIRLRTQDRWVAVDPAGSNGVGTVSFWYTRSNTPDWTCDVQVSTDGSIWNNVLNIPGPVDDTWHFASVDINQSGDVRVRWYLTYKNTGAILFDDVVITDNAGEPQPPSTDVKDWSLYE